MSRREPQTGREDCVADNHMKNILNPTQRYMKSTGEERKWADRHYWMPVGTRSGRGLGSE